MPKLERHVVDELRKNTSFEHRIYTLFKSVISNEVTLSSFRAIFSNFEKVDIYIMQKNQDDVGLVYFMYCKDPGNSKNLYIRPGLGIKDSEKGNFPKGVFANTMVRTRLQYLFKKVYMVSVTVNPIVYVVACKYWKQVYPKPTGTISESMAYTKDKIVSAFKMKEVKHDVIEIPFSLSRTKELKKNISVQNTKNPYMQYFYEKVKEEECNRGVLTIIPISFINLVTALKRKVNNDILKFIKRKFEPLFRDYSPVG